MTIKSTDFQVIRTQWIFLQYKIHTVVVLSRTQDCTLAYCSNSSTVVIPQNGSCVIKSVFSRKTSMENSQRHRLAVLACVVFCTEKQDMRKSWGKSWQKVRTVTVCNIRLQMPSGLIFLPGYCRTSIIGRPTWDHVCYLQFKRLQLIRSSKMIELTTHTQIIIFDQTTDLSKFFDHKLVDLKMSKFFTSHVNWRSSLDGCHKMLLLQMKICNFCWQMERKMF